MWIVIKHFKRKKSVKMPGKIVFRIKCYVNFKPKKNSDTIYLQDQWMNECALTDYYMFLYFFFRSRWGCIIAKTAKKIFLEKQGEKSTQHFCWPQDNDLLATMALSWPPKVGHRLDEWTRGWAVVLKISWWWAGALLIRYR